MKRKLCSPPSTSPAHRISIWSGASAPAPAASSFCATNLRNENTENFEEHRSTGRLRAGNSDSGGCAASAEANGVVAASPDAVVVLAVPTALLALRTIRRDAGGKLASSKKKKTVHRVNETVHFQIESRKEKL